MIDLAYEEDSRAEVDMNVVMTGSGRFVEVQATAEQKSFDDSQLGLLLALARGGVGSLIKVQQECRRGEQKCRMNTLLNRIGRKPPFTLQPRCS